MIKTNLYSAIKSGDSETLDSASQLGSQRVLMKEKCFEAVFKDS